jgi:amino acid adenylation domain-containing protein
VTTVATRGCVHELFAEQACRTPDAVALVSGGEQIRYGELNRRCNQLARYLRDAGVRAGEIVGIHLHRSIDSVVAMLAVLKTGAAYVPLEPGLPAQRQKLMMAECDVRFVITAPSLGWTDPTVRALSPLDFSATIAALPDSDLDVATHPESLMYVPYTSGSTGRPKGTGVPHRSVPGFFQDTDYAGWGPDQVALYHSAQSWDGHVLDLYPTLLTGGRVVIFPGTVIDPIEVARLARERAVTILWLTAAAFNAIVDSDPTLLAAVRCLLIGGETLSRPHVTKAMAALPRTRIVNGYGPSECTVFACVHPIDPFDLNRTSIPIGHPIGDRRVHLLGPTGQPVADGERGELYIGGPGVPRGYLRNARLTAERFVPDPFGGRGGARLFRTGDFARRATAGAIEFLGRGDDQVKIRGFRVELGEVEAALRELPGIRDAAVTIRGDAAAGTARLIGYVVPDLDRSVDPAQVRTDLRGRLPEPMVPAAVVVVGYLPLNLNGKVDRSRLPVPPHRSSGSSPGYAAPRTEVERCLSTIWQELFEVDEIGLRDNFFELGGHSLLASRTVARIRQRLGVEVKLRAVYDAPVLERLAAIVEKAQQHHRPPSHDE